jgi:hypothetical protein
MAQVKKKGEPVKKGLAPMQFDALVPPAVDIKLLVPLPARRAPNERMLAKAKSNLHNSRWKWGAMQELISHEGHGGIKCSCCDAVWGTERWSGDCPPYATYFAEDTTDKTKEK